MESVRRVRGRGLVNQSQSAVAFTLWLTPLLILLLVALAGPSVWAEDVADTAAYRLSTGDRIRITVFGHENLSGEFDIDGTGKISLPLIQIVEAAGLTTTELAAAITNKLQPDYLKSPRVSVDIVSYRPFYILGEVRNPGSYAFVNNMTVATAVALAGGYTYRAGKKKITVIRGTDPDKKKQRINEDTQIMPSDIIHIPERFF